MSLPRLSLAAVLIAVFCVPIFTWSQQPDDKEALDIAKIRHEWFYGPRRDPNRHARGDLRLKALQQAEQMRKGTKSLDTSRTTIAPMTAASTPTVMTASTGTTATSVDLTGKTWQAIGPQPMSNGGQARSGRVMDIVVDPSNSSVAYLGSAEGGVWKTTNAGVTWSPMTDHEASLATGALAIDPSSSNTIYVGTGEGTGGGEVPDQYFGAGILKSTDGGNSWTHIPGPFAKTTFGSGGSRFLSLSVQPTNPQTLIAAVSSDYQTDSGIWRSTDGANTWTQVLPCPNYVWSAFFASNGTAYSTCDRSGGTAKVLRSTDGGVTWSAVGSGLATPWDFIELTAAPSNPSVLYAGFEVAIDANNNLAPVIYKSVDGGTTFTQLLNSPKYCNQCNYANRIRVSPSDPNVVFAGGLDLWRTVDGGSSWTDVSLSTNGEALHADQHAIVFSANGSVMYEGNDGGVWSSTNYTATSSSSPAVTWTSLNTTLNTALLYPGLSIDPNNVSRAFAGTQDNGNLRYNGSLPWDVLFCGDGSYTVAPGNGTAYSTCFLGLFVKTHVYKSTADGTFGTWTEMPAVTTEAMVNITPPFVGDPSNTSRLYFGAQHVYMSNDGAQTWQAISPDLNTPLGAIAVSPSNPNVIWTGTRMGGNIHVTQNALAGTSATWSSVTALPKFRYLGGMAVDAHNPAVGYAAVAGFSGFGDTGHVFMSSNYGASWSDISGNLPNIPVNSIVVDPDAAGTLYVATDVGVFYTTNNGGSWMPAGSGLPNVVVQWLTLHEGTRTLRASTHGRGAWDLDLGAASGGGGGGCSAATVGVTICAPGSGATVSSPFTLSAASKGNATIKSMKAYLDGTGVATSTTSTLTAQLSAASGSHKLTVKGWDVNNVVYTTTEYFIVGTGGGTTCTASSTDRTVTICSPANGSTASSPVRFVAKTTDAKTVTAIAVYLDGTKIYTTNSSRLDASLSVSPGSHHVTIKAWDSAGSFSASESFTVQ